MLTETAIKRSKPNDKPYKLTDGRGLILLVQPSGAKWWRLRYKLWGLEKGLSLGVYPDVSLAQARERRDDARKLVADGIDPSDVRQQERNAFKDRFSVLAKEWADQQEWAPITRTKNERVIKYLNAEVGTRPVSKINTSTAYDALKKISQRGPDVGQMAYQIMNAVMLDALVLKLIEQNPVTGLSKKLPSPKRQNHAAVTDPAEFGKLLTAIDNHPGQPVVKLGLQFLALTFVRPSELRLAEWQEFDFNTGVWTIPAEKMKGRVEHTVPLAPQALAILEAAKALQYQRQAFVFPGLRPGRPLSENTFNVTLRSMGYTGDDHVSHGFRSSASTLLHALGFAPDVIEFQLAHKRKGVAGVYNRHHLLTERTAMMKAWGTYLDTLREQQG